MGYPVQLVTIGDRIRKKRMDMRLLQRGVAEMIGVSVVVVVEMWELRGHQPHPHSWPGVISFLGYDPYPQSTSTAEKVKAIRRRLGLTRRELAKQLHADPGAISRWEAGGEIHKIKHRKAIAQMYESLGVAIDQDSHASLPNA